ncbi:hypothetical protein TRFO_34318 [Tritrichomonas foetus]|uniref:Uncharacterized protein n=1 Tax=Tritrichomonas foetus TaxID=1144522 RepID=A0A1J4JP45_9EUKA|nr:hypothetical protein TRFO_34318 [Tritrichomonas foetus]|eukprot:OHS99283.1 hypothetical protein TRFO_34318 [Tritrichomonas foetus]
MENAFLRDSWNRRLPKQDFLILVKEKFDQSSISNLISILEDICSISNPSPLFIEYFGILVENFLILSLASIDFFYDTQISAYFNLISLYNETLFNNCNIGSKDDAHSALNALRVCLAQSPKQIIPQILMKLIRSSNYLILIASSRLLDRDYWKVVKKIYNDVQPFANYPISYPLLYQSFTHAFIDDFSSHHNFLRAEVDNLTFITNFLHILVINDFFAETFSRHFLIQLLMLFMNTYYRNGEILHGYAIHKLIHKICNKYENIEKDDLKLIVEDIEFTQNSHLMLPFYDDLDKLYNYLFVPRVFFDEEDFLSNFHFSPALCSKLTSMVIERIPTGSHQFFNSLLSDLNVFCCIFADKKVNILLTTLIAHIQTIRSAKYFEIVFNFFCSAFIFCWNLFDFDEIQAFLREQSSDVQILLKTIACLEVEKKGATLPIPIFTRPSGLPLPKIDTTTPFEKCIKFISSVDSMNGEEVYERIQKEPYLIMIALSEGIRHHRKDFIVLTKIKLPEIHPIIHRFRQMLAVILHDTPKWQNFVENLYASFDVMKVYPPSSVSEIEYYLLKDMYFCFRFAHAPTMEVFIISVRWSFWFQIFGVKNMIASIFKLLSKGEFSSPMSQPFLYFCISGICLTVATRRKGINIQIIFALLDLFEEDFEFNEDLIIKFFFIIFISLSEEEKQSLFIHINKLWEAAAKEETNKKRRLFNAISAFFKFVMYTPSMLKYLKDDMYTNFMMTGDCKALIDYFILLGNQKEFSQSI